MADLPPQQVLFVQEYLVDLNATQAAIRAGYSPKTAQEQSSRLLSNVIIQNEVARAMAERSDRTKITADRVLKEFARIAFGDPRSVMSWGNGGVTLKDSEELSDDDAAMVQEVSQVISKDGGSLKVKMYAKDNSLTQLGRHLGMFTDKLEIGDSDLLEHMPAALKDAELTPEQGQRVIAALAARAKKRA